MPSKTIKKILSSPKVDKTVEFKTGIRERFKMNSDWRFRRGEIQGAVPISTVFDDSSWRQIHLPHDFFVEFDAREEVFQISSSPKTGWYRKTFEVPVSDKGKNLWIDFDGICGKSTFWFNGYLLGTYLSDHIGIHFDITDLVSYDKKNVLTIYVDARSDEEKFYEGGGVYRHVWFNKSDYLRVAPCGIFVGSTIADGEEVPDEAEIEIRTKVLNGFQSALSFTVFSEIQDAQGKTVLSFSDFSSVGINMSAEVIRKVKLPSPILWSLQKPCLYRLVTQVEREGEIVDGVTTLFGIRSIRFDENYGFFLNNKPIKIKGTCNREDFAGIGFALPDRIITYKLEKLMEMGSNAYRCTHHPPSVELLNECDRLGLLVIDEHRAMREHEEVLSEVENMVLRDRNHPSIILWSLCDEAHQQIPEEAHRLGDKIKKVILKHDPTRLLTCAMNFENFDGEAGLTYGIDVQGFNFKISEYDPFHASHPKVPLYGSLTASAVSTRGIYENNPEKGHLSAYDVNYPEWGNRAEAAWKAIVERPFVFGGFVWTGFDYHGESTSLRKNSINFNSGIMDVCGFPKNTYYYYQSWWSNREVLHLFPHWNWQMKEGEEINVWCYSNCENVELLLNEKSQGIQKMPRNGHLEWKVKYHPGALRAIGMESGMTRIETMVETASAPVKVRLKPYQLEMRADGEDMIPVEVEILDWKNRLVPLSENEVVFSVKGPGKIAGVGNGDPSSREPDNSDRRKAFNGRCMVLLQAMGKPGEIKLTAKTPGLRHASVVLTSFS
jgi:beta-galactosidase